MRDKLITHNIYRIQDSNSVMCGFYCIAFIEYMIPEKTLLDYTNLFFPSDYKNDDNIINKYFKDKYVKSGVINHSDLMSEKYKKKYKHWNNVELLIILVSAVTGRVPISAFASLVCVPVGIMSSAVGIKICEITAEIKKDKSIMKKKKEA